ncbi:MAG: ferredoxin family protein [Candidatus Geothermarchaeales archaeon]
MTVDERLALVDIQVDEEPFITVDTAICVECEKKPCLYVCPAQVYNLQGDNLVYNTEGCIELGACGIVCQFIGEGAITWNYPRGGKGVNFRRG